MMKITNPYVRKYLLTERYHSLKTSINIAANEMVDYWANAMAKMGENLAPENLYGINYKNRLEAMFVFLMLVWGAVNQSTYRQELLLTKKLVREYTIKIQLVATGIADTMGALIEKKRPRKASVIEIYLEPDRLNKVMLKALGANYGIQLLKVLDEEEPVNIRMGSEGYKVLDLFLLSLKLTLVHEMKHFFQYVYNWDVETNRTHYTRKRQLSNLTLSRFSWFVYSTSPREIDSQIQAAFKLYQHYHKRKLDFFEALFLVFSSEELEAADVARDNHYIIEMMKIIKEHGQSTYFCTMWVIFCYIPFLYTRDDKLKQMAIDHTEKHRRQLEREELYPDPTRLAKNYQVIDEFCDELIKNKYPYELFVASVYHMDEKAFLNNIFSIDKDNSNVKQEYIDWVDLLSEDDAQQQDPLEQS